MFVIVTSCRYEAATGDSQRRRIAAGEDRHGRPKPCRARSSSATASRTCRRRSSSAAPPTTPRLRATPSTRTRRDRPSFATRSRTRSSSCKASPTGRPEVMSTVGGTMAINIAIRALVGRGDNAVIVSPAYAIYANSVIMSGGEPRLVPLARSGRRFSLDLERVERAIDRGTRLLVVNSPSNPTGWMMTEAEQRALAEMAERHDVVILSDEVYERLAFDTPIAPSLARIVDDKDRLIVVNSFSKTYNMTGWRLGWAQSSEAVVRQLYKAAEFITSNPSALVQQAGIVALRDGEDYVHELREHYARRRAQVSDAFRSLPGVTLPEPQGAFYAFPSHRGADRFNGIHRRAVAGDRRGARAGSGVWRVGRGLRATVLRCERGDVDRGARSNTELLRRFFRFCRFFRFEAGTCRSRRTRGTCDLQPVTSRWPSLRPPSCGRRPARDVRGRRPCRSRRSAGSSPSPSPSA